jgi:hypothetical protein
LRDHAGCDRTEFFRESAALINGTAAGPPDRIKGAEIMRRHGITPAPAP